MLFLRSLLFNVLFFGWTALVFIVCLPLLAAPRPALVKTANVWTGGIFAILRHVVGLDFEVRGRENLPEGGFVIASKHQSAWDTMVFHHISPNATYVLKRELMWVPLFGWYLKRFGVVAVNRGGGSQALRQMLRGAEAMAAKGRPILIFPEGTRTPPGQTRRYRAGVAALYTDLNLPVVPVALNSGLYWRRRAFRKLPGRIILEIRPPIPPGLPRGQFMERLRTEIEGTTERLVAEAQGDAPTRVSADPN